MTDTHLNLTGKDFVMYRLMHINRSHYVFVIQWTFKINGKFIQTTM